MSILSIILLKVEKMLGDDCGSLYQVHEERLWVGFSYFNSETFKIIRTKISTKLKIDITTNINTNTTTSPAIALTVFANYIDDLVDVISCINRLKLKQWQNL